MTIFMYTQFMLGIDIYCTITIPAWFIPCNYILSTVILSIFYMRFL